MQSDFQLCGLYTVSSIEDFSSLFCFTLVIHCQVSGIPEHHREAGAAAAFAYL